MEATPHRRRICPTTVGLIALCAAAGAWLLYQSRGTFFYFDEWGIWDGRRGYSLTNLFEPINDHASVVPVLLYNLIQTLTGGVDSFPYRLVAAAYHVGFVVLLFLYLRRRLGGALALCAVSPIAFLGTAWLVLLMPLSTIQIVGPLACGLGALLLADREGRAAEWAIAALLTICLFSWGGGIAIFAGVAVAIGAQRRRDRIWALAIPAVLWAVWFGVERPSSGFQPDDLTLIPRYVASGAAAGFGSYTGLGQGFGWVLAAALGALLVAAVWRRRGVSSQLAAAAVMGIGFWALIAISRGHEVTPAEVRYHYTDAVLVVLVAAQLVPAAVSRWRLASPQVALAALLAVAFTIPNLQDFRTAGRNYRQDAALSRADVYAIQLARDRVDRDFRPADARDPELETGHILNSLADGKMLVEEADIRDSLEVERERADATLIAALRLGAEPGRDAEIDRKARPRVEGAENGEVRFSPGCVRLQPSLGTAALLVGARAPVVLDPGGGRAEVRLRRFGDGFRAGRPLAVIEGGPRVLPLPRDASHTSWHLRIHSGSPVRVCTAASGRGRASR